MNFFTTLGEVMREVSREDLKRKEELMKRRSDLMYLIMQYNIEAKALGLKPIELCDITDTAEPSVEPTAETNPEEKKDAAIKSAEGVSFRYSREAECYIINVLGGKRIGVKRYAV